MAAFASSTFVPWKAETILKHEAFLEGILLNSFLPGNPAASFTNVNIMQVLNSLEATATCKLCQLLHSLCVQFSPSISFYGDYAAICYYALYAPKTCSATLMLLADLVDLLEAYFSCSQFDLTQLNGADVYLHFFVNKCFKPVNKDQLFQMSNLNSLKVEFLKAGLTGVLSSTFCFKNIWPTICPIVENKKNACNCDLGQVTQDTSIFQRSFDTKNNFLDLILLLWKDSDLLTPKNKELAATLANQQPCFKTLCSLQNQTDTLDIPPELDLTQGPCLMSPPLHLSKKNHTSSLCLLCECLACHSETAQALSTLKEIILNSFGNNVKLIDRILFILEDQDALAFISDRELLKPVLQNCSPQEIHKHMFCDPLCALNTVLTDQKILFAWPDEAAFQDFKTTLATGLYLNHGSLSACEFLETLIFMFKGIQNSKVNKTTTLEIIREVDASLKKHNIQVLNAYHTFQSYK
ncbi:putative major envelope glycoprotein [Bovine gammaherpesvirus 6]|uniref:Packaging protein UL32 n=1 Tax=Bovine gammaherpesvirus 6 TaxID=1504288 RepID=A0A060D355_9GAMA|nr:putative major envelope glycoprotein [Bovine gammaherpesvirus 6]AIB03224.1 putative major envelope glycoprotein [Bovine gammaherpesvirus 6]